MGEVKVLGIDLSKSVYVLHGVDGLGRVVLQKRLSRKQFGIFMAQLPGCLVGIEACGSAHYWARTLLGFGHDVRPISPQFVKPYVKTNKTDQADAEAICEAVSRPNMRFVSVKSVEQQDVLSLHRVRRRVVRARTALANEIRGLLAEYGIVIAKGLAPLRRDVAALIGDIDDARLTPMGRNLFTQLYDELVQWDAKVNDYNEAIERIYSQCSIAQRLTQIPGIGPLTATALVASVGDARVFKNGRQLAAFLGLVPKEHSSGGKQKLLGISKRGDAYLRTLLIHGGRAVVRCLGNKQDRLSCWTRQLVDRRGKNIAAVAVANKNARTAWALMLHSENYCIQ